LDAGIASVVGVACAPRVTKNKAAIKRNFLIINEVNGYKNLIKGLI